MKKKILFIIKEIVIEISIMLLVYFVIDKLVLKKDFKLESFLLLLILYIAGNITSRIVAKRKERKNQ